MISIFMNSITGEEKSYQFCKYYTVMSIRTTSGALIIKLVYAFFKTIALLGRFQGAHVLILDYGITTMFAILSGLFLALRLHMLAIKKTPWTFEAHVEVHARDHAPFNDRTDYI